MAALLVAVIPCDELAERVERIRWLSLLSVPGCWRTDVTPSWCAWLADHEGIAPHDDDNSIQ